MPTIFKYHVVARLVDGSTANLTKGVEQYRDARDQLDKIAEQFRADDAPEWFEGEWGVPVVRTSAIISLDTKLEIEHVKDDEVESESRTRRWWRR
jgi:hypothetical protein